MLMKDNKKNAATIIMAKMSKGPSMVPKSEPEGAESDSSDELDFAAEEVLSAMERKDSRALKEAMKSFVQMCMDQYESEEPEEASEEA